MNITKPIRGENGSTEVWIFIALVAWAITFGLSSQGDRAVTGAEIKQLSEMAAAASPEAEQKLKVFLSNNPTPTKSEIKEIREYLTQQSALAVTKEVTGNKNLKSRNQTEMEEQQAREAEERALAKKVKETPFWSLSLEEKSYWFLGHASNVLPACTLLMIIISAPALLNRHKCR